MWDFLILSCFLLGYLLEYKCRFILNNDYKS